MRFRLIEDLESNRRSLLKKLNNDEDALSTIMDVDPSIQQDDNGNLKGEGKFLLWLGKIFQNNGNKFNNELKTKDALTFFYKNTNKFQNKDINQFKSEQDLINACDNVKAQNLDQLEVNIKNMEKTFAQGLPYPGFDIKKAKEGCNLVYKDSDWLVYIPENYEASVYLRGQNAEWCTGRHKDNKKDDSFYNQYTEDGSKLYIIINRKNKDEKYQVTVHPDGSWQEFNNAQNKSLNDNQLDNLFIHNIKLGNYLNSICDGFMWLVPYTEEERDEILTNGLLYKNDCHVPKWITKVIVDNDVHNLPYDCFKNCKYLKTIDLNNVTTINSRCFKNCISIEYIDLKNVTKLGAECFCNCKSLKNINLNNIDILEESCFENCESLTSIDLKNINWLGDFCFKGCTSLQKINLSD